MSFFVEFEHGRWRVPPIRFTHTMINSEKVVALMKVMSHRVPPKHAVIIENSKKVKYIHVLDDLFLKPEPGSRKGDAPL